MSNLIVLGIGGGDTIGSLITGGLSSRAIVAFVALSLRPRSLALSLDERDLALSLWDRSLSLTVRRTRKE